MAKLSELRRALDQHLQSLMAEAKRDEAAKPFDRDALQLSDKELRSTAEQAERAAKEGRLLDARREMEQLEKMLDALRNSVTQNGHRDGDHSSRERAKGQQSVLQDMITREGALLDHSQRRSGPNRSNINPKREGEADVRVQQALRRAIGELMQEFTDLTGEVSPNLGEADKAMRDAASALNRQEDNAAAERQQQAIAALQAGSREVGQAVAKMGEQASGEQEDGQGSGAAEARQPTESGQEGGAGNGAAPLATSRERRDMTGQDPLGRSAQGRTSANDAGFSVPEERERQHTRAIREELRRRGADQQRPRDELDYIDRLLKRF